jgi:Bacterial SH3 domain
VAVEEPPKVAAEPPKVAAAKPPRVAAAKPPRVAAAKPPRVAAAKPPRVAVEPPRVATRPRRVAVEPPRVAVEQRPALTTELQSDIMGYARIIAENANLRERPGVQYRLISVLPRNREVAVLRQLHINTNGEAWVEVLAATDQGWRKGWVMRRFLDSCNCPTY